MHDWVKPVCLMIAATGCVWAMAYCQAVVEPVREEAWLTMQAQRQAHERQMTDKGFCYEGWLDGYQPCPKPNAR